MLSTDEKLGFLKGIILGYAKQFPKGVFFTKEESLVIIKYILEEVLKWDDEEILQKYNNTFFSKYKILKIYNNIFDSNHYEAFNAAYPGQFYPWEFKYKPAINWDENMCILATRWLVTEKMKLSGAQIRKTVKLSHFTSYGLDRMLSNVVNWDTQKAIQLAYPELF